MEGTIYLDLATNESGLMVIILLSMSFIHVLQINPIRTVQSLFKQCIFEGLLQIFYYENQVYNEENFKPKQRFYYSKLT
jgi:hypothetical protein